MPEASSQAAGSLDAASALRDFCAAQLAHAAKALGRGSHPHRGVHETRKSVRRLRSVLALGARHFGEHGEKIDRMLQRLGRGLSRLRDAHVALELARTRRREAVDEVQRVVWDDIVALLGEARREALRRVRAQDPEFRKRLHALARAGVAIAALPWQKLSCGEVRKQLARSRRRARRAQRDALSDTSLPALHTWRKRLRRRRMQLNALLAILENTPAEQLGELRIIVHDATIDLPGIIAQVDTIGARLDVKLLQLAVRRLPHGAARKAGLTQLRKAAPFDIDWETKP